jgi:hypothetical protein
LGGGELASGIYKTKGKIVSIVLEIMESQASQLIVSKKGPSDLVLPVIIINLIRFEVDMNKYRCM